MSYISLNDAESRCGISKYRREYAVVRPFLVEIGWITEAPDKVHYYPTELSANYLRLTKVNGYVSGIDIEKLWDLNDKHRDVVERIRNGIDQDRLNEECEQYVAIKQIEYSRYLLTSSDRDCFDFRWKMMADYKHGHHELENDFRKELGLKPIKWKM